MLRKSIDEDRKDGIDMAKYEMNNYFNDIDKKGLSKTWHSILSKTLNKTFESDIFVVDNFGELYEIGLEHVNKINKKEMGKYYTPKDVSFLMSKWMINLKGEKICDVGCGCGNLILSYLECIGIDETIKLINNGYLYLYDLDEIALNICKYSIAIKYGKKLLGNNVIGFSFTLYHFIKLFTRKGRYNTCL